MFAIPASMIAGDDAADEPPVLFEQLPVVETASLHSQTLQEAPASVTIITDEDIRRYGYRTLGEALAGVRGFYLSYDREYESVGLRGFSLPGDYNTRFLVMINGHCMTENIYGSNNFFGQDFGLDLDLVKRIEIVRGPSSALYGSNGIFATINLITKSPVDQPAGRVTAELGSFGEKKVSASTSLYLGHGVNLLVSASVFNNAGQSLYFPEFNSPGTNNGVASGVDGEKGYHTFLNLVWREWTFTAYFNSREEHLPAAPYGTLFDDKGTSDVDRRNFLEAAYTRDIGARGHLHWRLYYDQYRFAGRYDYATGAGIEDNRDLGLGDWAGTQVTYRVDTQRGGGLTVGLEFNGDIRAVQRNYDVSPADVEFLNLNNPSRTAAVFGQYEFKIAPRWTAYLGARLDKTWGYRPVPSPRAALIYQQSPGTVFKMLYGGAFRNPNVFERYYDDHGFSQMANPSLQPEKAQTFEVDVEHKLTQRLNAIANAYHYTLRDLIQAVPDGAVVQYRNVSRAQANGIEFELNGHPWGPLETVASFSLQRAEDAATGARLVNSPQGIVQFRASAPLLRNRLDASAAVRYLDARICRDGTLVPGYYVADLTVASVHLHRDFDLQAGVRNLFDRRYSDPTGFSDAMQTISEDGRSVFLKLIWYSGQ
jgi:iron complex outermembrane receptor protein